MPDMHRVPDIGRVALVRQAVAVVVVVTMVAVAASRYRYRLAARQR
jgi:hypothetical protein